MYKIDDELCEKILEDYSDNPLIAAVDPADMRNLLKASFFFKIVGPEVQAVDIILSEYHHLFGDYFKVTDPRDVAVPAVLLCGSARYAFSPGFLPVPLAATITAPIIGYITPYVFESRAAHPDVTPTLDSEVILFPPEAFRATAYKNPQLFEVMINGRERIYNMISRWLPITALTSIEYRIAQFLLAQLPENPKDQEVIELTQSAIATYLNCSRATLAKGISHLYNEGVLQTGHGKLIVDTNELKNYIRGGKEMPPPPHVT